MARIRNEIYFAMIPEWILYSDISPNAIRLYCILNRYGGKDGVVAPSRQELAKKMNASTDTIDRAKKELVKIQALTIHRRSVEGTNVLDTNEYVVWFNPPGSRKNAGSRTEADRGTRRNAHRGTRKVAEKVAANLRQKDFREHYERENIENKSFSSSSMIFQSKNQSQNQNPKSKIPGFGMEPEV